MKPMPNIESLGKPDMDEKWTTNEKAVMIQVRLRNERVCDVHNSDFESKQIE